MMAVALRNFSNVVYALHTNITLTAPAGIQDGDILLIVFGIGGTVGSIELPTPPAGFATVSASIFPYRLANSTDGFAIYAWWKVASSESGDYVVTHRSASSYGYMGAYSGADNTTPFNPDPTANRATGATTTALTISTPVDNSLVVFLSSDWGAHTNTLAAPVDDAPVFTLRLTDGASSGRLVVADGIMPTAGLTGNETIANNNFSGLPSAGLLFSIQPTSLIPDVLFSGAWRVF